MEIPHEIKKFRSERANDLRILAKLFEENQICAFPIYDAIRQLLDFNMTMTIDNKGDFNYWGYEIVDLTIPFQREAKVIYPKDLTLLELRLNCKVIADYKAYGKMSDPLIHLEFDVIIEGESYDVSDICYTGFHIDRHIEGEDEPDEIHPIYHVHFGGRALKYDEKKFGQSLFLGAPRIMHYPMDLILGVDFIIGNYFPNLMSNFHSEHDFISILKEQQKMFWKPFAHSLANHWLGYDSTKIAWDSKSIWPQLI